MAAAAKDFTLSLPTFHFHHTRPGQTGNRAAGRKANDEGDLAMMGFSGWGTAGMFAMMVGILVVVAVAATALVLIFRPVFDGRGHSTDGSTNQTTDSKTTPQASFFDSLEERYARGEIDRAEFLARRRLEGR
jgi:uncharacterized membrane protein